jgi:Icc-related predicted phosphoesterase
MLVLDQRAQSPVRFYADPDMKLPRLTCLWFRLAAAAALSSSACEHSKPATGDPPSSAVAGSLRLSPSSAQGEERALKECAAPIEPAAASQVQIANRRATLAGFKLSFEGPSPGGQIVFAALGPINEDSASNIAALKKYLKFFADQKADAILVSGDVGETPSAIAHVLKVLASSKLPVLVVAGNRECRADFAEGVAEAQREFKNVVNLNQVREVEFAEATVISLPGYHDPNFINCATGCRYYASTIDEVVQMANRAKSPAVLVSHGPPRGEGSQALDYAISGGNVGDEQLSRAIRLAKIRFGVFSNIKEAGARATDLAGTTVMPPETPAASLYLNPGPADTTPWDMNDGSKSTGMAAVLAIKDGQASWRAFRIAPSQKQAAPSRKDPAQAVRQSSAKAELTGQKP